MIQRSSDEAYTIVGLISFAYNCRNGLHARVDSGMDFVNDFIGNLEK